MGTQRVSFLTRSLMDALISIVTYYPLILTCLTTILNIFIVIIFCQKTFRDRPAILYFQAMAIVDGLMLYGWNLDHFFLLKFNFEVDRLSIMSCKFASFFNNFFIQSSAWLRVCTCIDRYFTLDHHGQTRRIERTRQVLGLIFLTFFLISLLNLHLPIFACYSFENGTKISGASLHYNLYPMWNYVIFSVYNVIPFLLMSIFNILIIRQLIIMKRRSSIQRSRIPHLSITISILLSTALFCLMTTPPSIIYAFFYSFTKSVTFKRIVLSICDSIKYSYHASSFFIYFITLKEFRRTFFSLLKFRWIQHASSSSTTTPKFNNRSGDQQNPVNLTPLANVINAQR